MTRPSRLAVPFEIAVGVSDTGPRFGGNAPAGVVPRLARARAQYLFTVPLGPQDASIELSVFLSFTDDEMLDLADTVAEPGPFEALVHSAASRGSEPQFASRFAALPLRLGPEVADVAPGAPHLPLGGHKLRGVSLLHTVPSIRPQIDKLSRAGYEHLVQLDFPTSDEAVKQRAIKGSWPFGDGMFSVFGRAPYGTADFRAIWRYH